MAMTKHFAEITIDWGDDTKLLNDKLSQRYIFRGQSNKKWKLKTTLERATERFQNKNDNWDREKNVLEKFKSRAYQYLQSAPTDIENIEWLSILQDYGGPTRLLDFTESFYIASFFAVEGITSPFTEETEFISIWAINRASLINNAIRRVDFDRGKTYYENLISSKEILHYAELFIASPERRENNVLVVKPTRINERLAVQRGLFLFPCDIDNSFEENLCNSFELPFDNLDPKNVTTIKLDNIEKYFDSAPVIKINIPVNQYDRAMFDLYHMNIDYASLFPGLDGFAKSLHFQAIYTGLRFTLGSHS